MGIYRKIREAFLRLKSSDKPVTKSNATSSGHATEALTDFTCGRYSIRLPKSHLLPTYQRDHALYDRFLPILAQHLPDDALVIDVGANVGDTVAAMASRNDRLHYVCIEPEATFFNLLKMNTENMARTMPLRHPPILKQAFVGEAPIVGSLVSAGGTAKVQADSSANLTTTPYVTLSDVLTECGNTGSSRHPILVKSDVDGWDFNVIRSLGKRIEDKNLLVFMECQTQTRQQFESFMSFFGNYTDPDYTFTVFDNFGNILLEDATAKIVQSLLSYVWRQERGVGTRTIWYLDILISTTLTRPLARSAVHAYRQEYFQSSDLV